MNFIMNNYKELYCELIKNTSHVSLDELFDNT